MQESQFNYFEDLVSYLISISASAYRIEFTQVQDLNRYLDQNNHQYQKNNHQIEGEQSTHNFKQTFFQSEKTELFYQLEQVGFTGTCEIDLIFLYHLYSRFHKFKGQIFQIILVLKNESSKYSVINYAYKNLLNQDAKQFWQFNKHQNYSKLYLHLQNPIQHKDFMFIQLCYINSPKKTQIQYYLTEKGKIEIKSKQPIAIAYHLADNLSLQEKIHYLVFKTHRIAKKLSYNSVAHLQSFSKNLNTKNQKKLFHDLQEHEQNEQKKMNIHNQEQSLFEFDTFSHVSSFKSRGYSNYNEMEFQFINQGQDKKVLVIRNYQGQPGAVNKYQADQNFHLIQEQQLNDFFVTPYSWNIEKFEHLHPTSIIYFKEYDLILGDLIKDLAQKNQCIDFGLAVLLFKLVIETIQTLNKKEIYIDNLSIFDIVFQQNNVKFLAIQKLQFGFDEYENQILSNKNLNFQLILSKILSQNHFREVKGVLQFIQIIYVFSLIEVQHYKDDILQSLDSNIFSKFIEDLRDDQSNVAQKVNHLILQFDLLAIHQEIQYNRNDLDEILGSIQQQIYGEAQIDIIIQQGFPKNQIQRLERQFELQQEFYYHLKEKDSMIAMKRLETLQELQRLSNSVAKIEANITSFKFAALFDALFQAWILESPSYQMAIYSKIFKVLNYILINLKSQDSDRFDHIHRYLQNLRNEFKIQSFKLINKNLNHKNQFNRIAKQIISSLDSSLNVFANSINDLLVFQPEKTKSRFAALKQYSFFRKRNLISYHENPFLQKSLMLLLCQKELTQFLPILQLFVNYLIIKQQIVNNQEEDECFQEISYQLLNQLFKRINSIGNKQKTQRKIFRLLEEFGKKYLQLDSYIDEAELFFDALVSIKTQLVQTNYVQTVNLYYFVSKIKKYQGKFLQVEGLFETSMAMLQQKKHNLGDTLSLVFTLDRAINLINLDQIQEANKILIGVLPFLKSQEVRGKFVFQCQINLARTFEILGNPEQAVQYYVECLEQLKGTNPPPKDRLLAFINFQIAFHLIQINRIKQIQKYLQSFEKYQTDLKDPQLALCYYHLGKINLRQRNFKKSQIYIQKYLNHKEKPAHSITIEGQMSEELGIIKMELHLFEEAVEHLKLAQEIYETTLEPNDQRKIDCKFHIARISGKNWEIQKSLELHQEVFEKRVQYLAGDDLRIGQSLIQLAQTQNQMRDFSRANLNYHKSAKHFFENHALQNNEVRRYFCQALIGLCNFYLEQNELGQVEELLTPIVSFRDDMFKTGDPLYIEIMEPLIQFYILTQNYGQSEKLAKECLGFAWEIYQNGDEKIADCMYMLAEAFQLQNQANQASGVYMQAIQMYNQFCKKDHPMIKKLKIQLKNLAQRVEYNSDSGGQEDY